MARFLPPHALAEVTAQWLFFQTRYRVSPSLRGLNLCFAKNRIASIMQSDPTTMYAMPKNGLRPPNHEVVDITSDFLPSKVVTTKSAQ